MMKQQMNNCINCGTPIGEWDYKSYQYNYVWCCQCDKERAQMKRLNRYIDQQNKRINEIKGLI